MYLKCCVKNCVNTRSDAILHKFPQNENRLKKWLQCLSEDIPQESHLRNLFVCQKHFEKKFITDNVRLKSTAYPTLFTPDEISCGMPVEPTEKDGAPLEDHNYSRKRHCDHSYAKDPRSSTSEQIPALPAKTRARVRPEVSVEPAERRLDRIELETKLGQANEGDDIVYDGCYHEDEPEPEPVIEGPFSWQQSSAVVPCDADILEETPPETNLWSDVQSKPAKDEDHETTLELKISDYEGEPCKSEQPEYRCNFCEELIHGYRYACVQCTDYDLCTACEARGAHMVHYVLRIPASKPQDEVEAVLKNVRCTINSYISLINDDIVEVKEEKPDIEDCTQLQGEATDLQSELMCFQSDSADLQGKVLSLQEGDVMYLQKSNIALEGDVMYLQGDAIDRQGNVMSLQEGEVMYLQGDATDIHGNIMCLQGDAINLEGDVVYLQRDSTDLQGEVMALQEGDVMYLHGDATNLQGDVMYLQRDSIDLQKDTTVLQRDRTDLQRDPIDLQQDAVYLQENPIDFQVNPVDPQEDPIGVQIDPEHSRDVQTSDFDDSDCSNASDDFNLKWSTDRDREVEEKRKRPSKKGTNFQKQSRTNLELGRSKLHINEETASPSLQEQAKQPRRLQQMHSSQITGSQPVTTGIQSTIRSSNVKDSNLEKTVLKRTYADPSDSDIVTEIENLLSDRYKRAKVQCVSQPSESEQMQISVTSGPSTVNRKGPKPVALLSRIQRTAACSVQLEKLTEEEIKTALHKN